MNNRVFRKDLPTEKLCEGVYRLNEFDGTNCYLVLGTERALLIDCGSGFCDLLGRVKELTDLPVVLAATHGHGDHTGGKGQFERIYVHEDDCTRINRFQNTTFFRKILVQFNATLRANGFSANDVRKPQKKTEVLPMKDGQVFDLGGCQVRVKHTIGHSKGSVAFVDDHDKIVFSGDNVCDALWMQLPGAASLEEWIPSAEWLLEMSKEYAVYWGHRVARLTPEYIEQVLIWGREIIANTDRNTLFYKIRQYPAQEDGIIYRTDKVFARKKKKKRNA